MCSSSDFEFSAVVSGRFARWLLITNSLLTPSQHPDLHFMFTISLGPRILSYLAPSTSCCTLNFDSFSSRSGAIARAYWMDLFVVVDGKDQRPKCPNAPDKLLSWPSENAASSGRVPRSRMYIYPICFCPQSNLLLSTSPSWHDMSNVRVLMLSWLWVIPLWWVCQFSLPYAYITSPCRVSSWGKRNSNNNTGVGFGKRRLPKWLILERWQMTLLAVIWHEDNISYRAMTDILAGGFLFFGKDPRSSRAHYCSKCDLFLDALCKRMPIGCPSWAGCPFRVLTSHIRLRRSTERCASLRPSC